MKKNIKLFIGIIIGIIISTVIGVSATILYSASEVGFTPANPNWHVDNLESALNDLYTQKENNSSGTSSIISSVSFTESVASNKIHLSISTGTTNSNNIIGYHAFAEDQSGNMYSAVSSNNSLSIVGLTSGETYSTYVVVYDKDNNYKKSSSKNVTLTESNNLIPTLTSNSSGPGTAFATYTANGRNAYEAFDGVIDPSTAYGNRPGYMVSNTTTNQIGYDFGENNEKLVNKIVYYGQPNDDNCKYTTITLQYSDNGSTWTDVQTFTPTNPTSYVTVNDLAETFEVTNDVDFHRYWRISGTNTGYNWSGLIELQFWGY